MRNSKCLIAEAKRTDISRLASLLARSLEDDPLQRWIFPDDRYRSRRTRRHFKHLLKPRLKHGLVTTIEYKSAAVWVPPDNPPPSGWERYRESFYMRTVFGGRVHQVRDAFRAMAQRHPNQPHWYLLALATDTNYRGQGLARKLLEQMLDRCETEGTNIVLETATSENVAYYEKFGFKMIHELQLEAGPTIWLMCR